MADDGVTVKAEALVEAVCALMELSFRAGQADAQREGGRTIDMMKSGYNVWVDREDHVHVASHWTGDFVWGGMEPEALDLVRTFGPELSSMLGGEPPPF